MDLVLLAKAALMGVVEGLTEFLPISSTGHLILAGSLLGFDDAKAKVFDIAIQTGAIFAVILVYWQKIRATLVALPRERSAQRLVLNVLIGFLPAVVLGPPGGWGCVCRRGTCALNPSQIPKWRQCQMALRLHRQGSSWIR